MAARLTAAEKVARDAKLVADRARGLTWGTIACRYRISERQARTIWAERRSALADALQRDLSETLEEAIAGLDAAVEDLALLAETTPNDSVRLGAIKARMTAMTQRFELLQACGLLPRDSGLWRYDVDARQLVNALVETFNAHQIPDETLDALRLVLGAHSARRELPAGDLYGTPASANGGSHRA